jgi:histidinol dehydrogenase
MRIRPGLSRPEPPPGHPEEVAEILGAVRRRGDRAVIEFTERFDQAELGPDELQVDPLELERSVGKLEPAVVEALGTSIANVQSVAEAQLREPRVVEGRQGQLIDLTEVPVGRAGIYVPGGRAPYLSTVVMCAVTARVAGVRQVAACTPPDPGGMPHPAVLAACVLCELKEVYRMGGAQAVAALAYGTESVPAVDVIVGPGNAWVTEAKRQVFGSVGIDGLAGPSELLVICGSEADAEIVALDLLAQAEHGPDSLLALITLDEPMLQAVVAAVERLVPQRPSVTDAELRVASVEDPLAALIAAEELAPEHLQLVGQDVEALAGSVRRAGCVFVGPGAGTAFGDYVAGSNHVLPTGGAAGFGSALSPATFRRRMARVSLPGEAPARLAPAGAALARAEGFPVHAESMERRA